MNCVRRRRRSKSVFRMRERKICRAGTLSAGRGRQSCETSARGKQCNGECAKSLPPTTKSPGQDTRGSVLEHLQFEMRCISNSAASRFAFIKEETLCAGSSPCGGEMSGEGRRPQQARRAGACCPFSAKADRSLFPTETAVTRSCSSVLQSAPWDGRRRGRAQEHGCLPPDSRSYGSAR